MLFREGFWNSDESMPFTSANSPESFLLSPLAAILQSTLLVLSLTRASCYRFMTGLDRVLCVSMLEMFVERLLTLMLFPFNLEMYPSTNSLHYRLVSIGCTY